MPLTQLNVLGTLRLLNPLSYWRRFCLHVGQNGATTPTHLGHRRRPLKARSGLRAVHTAAFIHRDNPYRPWQHGWDVVCILVERDLKALFKRSFVGVGQPLLSPLLHAIIFIAVLQHVLNIAIGDYASFVLTGVLVWGWFQASLVHCTRLITGNRALVRQPQFPFASLPHAVIGVRLFHFLIALPFLAGLLWWQGNRPSPAWAAIPLLILVQFAFTAGLAYPLAAINVRQRNTQHVVPASLQAAMYLSPVFYDIEALPETSRAWFQLNPMAALLTAWRDVLMHARWPNPAPLAVLTTFSFVLLFAGWRFFAARSRHFAEEL